MPRARPFLCVQLIPGWEGSWFNKARFSDVNRLDLGFSAERRKLT